MGPDKMIRTVSMPILIEIERVDYQGLVAINLDHVSLCDWCLNLSLLKEELVDVLTFIGNKKLQLKIDGTLERSARAVVSISPGAVSISFHPDEYDYVHSFFLKYYRDGVAEVDHIDIEALAFHPAGKTEEVYVTFYVKDAVPPMSPDEMRRLLDATD